MPIRILLGLAGLALLAWAAMPIPAEAVVCARGVVRAGCAGPNGAAVVRRPVAAPVTTCRIVNGVRVCKRHW
jgi:hypothetical protein